MNAPEPNSPYDQTQPEFEPERAAPATPAAQPPAPLLTEPPLTERPRGHAVRMRTVVFGLLLGLVALMMVVARTTSVQVDGVAVAIGALIVAGVLMIVGSLTAVARERRGG